MLNMEKPTKPISSIWYVWLTFAILIFVFNLVFHPLLPSPDGRMGSDYAYFLPAWLDGHFWFQNNGLATPWFTPSFCAGQPFFADPQSSYYSLPQFLAIVLSPLAAAYALLLITAALMFWGGYLCMRKLFALDPFPAVLVGGLLMFDGFLPARMLIGHMTFHGFALVPWIALLLLMPAQRRINQAAAAVGAGLLIAYWIQSGFGTQILIAGFAVFLLALLHCLNGGSIGRFLVRGVSASLVAILLSAAKLWATFSFMSHFPRNDYALPGAASIPDGLVMIAGALFLPSQWASALGNPFMENVQWVQDPQEWAYGLGIGAAILLAALLINLLRTSERRLPKAPRQIALLAILTLCLLWPLAFCLYTPSWNAFLKTLPILNTATTPLRWIFSYVPILAAVIGIMLQRAKWGRMAHVAVFACLVLTTLQALVEPRQFYKAQPYDSLPVSVADRQLRAGQLQPGISMLGLAAPASIGGNETVLRANDTLIAGMSQGLCYNPVFGYLLENLRTGDMKEGPVLAEQNGFLNLKNPACYVFPKENNCQPGDRFKADQLEQAKAFAAYKPFAFQMSAGQKIASLVTEWTLFLLALAAVAWGGSNLLALARRAINRSAN